MLELAPLIKDLAIMLGVASILALLFQKIKQPIILAYLFSGILIGPFFLPYPLITDINSLNTLSELGVIFLMFSLGLEFSFHKLTRVGMPAVITGIFEVILMIILGFIIGWLLSWSFYDCLFLGAALAISSTLIIIKEIDDLGLKQRHFSELIFGILIVEDLVAILLLVGLSLIVRDHTVLMTGLANATIKLLVVVGSWFLVGYFLIPPLIRKIVNIATQETITVVAVALCLALTCLAVDFGYSSALGAFIMGSILAETELIHSIEQFIKPLRDIFAAVFFIAIGMRIDPSVLSTHASSALIIALLTIMMKSSSITVGTLLTGERITTAIRTGFGMAQIGEFSFIIAALGISLHVTSPILLPVIVFVSALTTFTTPYLIRISGPLSKAIERRFPEHVLKALEHYSIFIDRYFSLSKRRIPYVLYMTRLWVNAVLIAIVFSSNQQWLIPLLKPMIHTQVYTNLTVWFISFLITSPFIWGMLFSGSALLAPAHFKSIAYFILGLGWLFTLTVITTVSITYFKHWIVALALLFFGVLILLSLYRPLKRIYLWLEQCLIQNIKSNQQQYSFKMQLNRWNVEMISLDLCNDYSMINKSLKELALYQRYRIDVLAIIRGPRYILNPEGSEKIRLCDKLILLGEDDAIALFLGNVDTGTQEEFDLPEYFELKTIKINSDSALIGRTLSQVLAKYKSDGLIFGIERDNTRTLRPNPETRLRLWDRITLLLTR
jgi:monovalent cation:H+ antiporter-2, CPA2 family